MTHTYPAIDGGESSCFLTSDGGVISLTGEPPRLAGLERITTTPTGVAFGPLQVSTPDRTADDEDDHTVAAVENLRFAPDDESDLADADDDTGGWLSGFLGFSLVGGAAATDDTVDLTRRQTIGVVAGALALGGVTATAAADDTARINFARFDLARADGPVHVSILDLVDDALPADVNIRLDVDGARRAEWTPADALESDDDPNGETLALEDGESATVRVYAEGGVGRITALLAWAQGVLASGAEIKATTTLPKPASEYAEDETATITTHPAYTEPLRESGGDEDVVTIGDESIPHADERWGHDRGYYDLEDGALVYVAGDDPPDSELVDLRLRAGRLSSTTDAINRL